MNWIRRIGAILALLMLGAGGATAYASVNGWPNFADHNFYVSTTGNDTTNDCLSWGTSCRTISHVIAMVNDHGLNIHVAAGTYTETVNFGTRSDINVDGTGSNGGDARSTRIIPPCDTCEGFHFGPGTGNTVRNLGVRGSATWSGVGFHILSAGNVLENVVVRNPDNTPTATLGGIGYYLEQGENNLFMHYNCSWTNLCLKIGIPYVFGQLIDGSDNTFIDGVSSASWTNLLINSGNGGNTFIRLKMVNQLCTNGSVGCEGLTINGDNNAFTTLDFIESNVRPNYATVAGMKNIFDDSTSGSQTEFTISGHHNIWRQGFVQRLMTVSGHDNMIEDVQCNGNCVDTGLYNRWDNIWTPNNPPIQFQPDSTSMFPTYTNTRPVCDANGCH